MFYSFLDFGSANKSLILRLMVRNIFSVEFCKATPPHNLILTVFDRYSTFSSAWELSWSNYGAPARGSRTRPSQRLLLEVSDCADLSITCAVHSTLITQTKRRWLLHNTCYYSSASLRCVCVFTRPWCLKFCSPFSFCNCILPVKYLNSESDSYSGALLKIINSFNYSYLS
jgi:hypothetical protein